MSKVLQTAITTGTVSVGLSRYVHAVAGVAPLSMILLLGCKGGASTEHKLGCREVVIDSAGKYEVFESKLAGWISAGPPGNEVYAADIRFVIPKNLKGVDADEVSTAGLIWDDGRAASCDGLSGDHRVCTRSLSGTGLRIFIEFKRNNPPDLQGKIKALADYAASQVICRKIASWEEVGKEVAE